MSFAAPFSGEGNAIYVRLAKKHSVTELCLVTLKLLSK